jgi:ABC-type spermidine/putrescine transport system permease subunit II
MSPGGSAWNIAATLYAVMVATYLIAPIVILAIISFGSARYIEFPPSGWSLRWYANYFTSEAWRDATLLSFRIAATTSILALILGTTLALAIVRGPRRLAGALQLLVVLPMIVPPIVTAIGLFWLSAKLGILGTAWAIIIGHTSLALPYVVLSVVTSLRGVSPSIERAAASLGGNAWYVFRRVTLPLIAPGVLSGAILAFATSFEEGVIAIILSSPSTLTLPKRLWDSIEMELDPTISAVASLLILLSALLLFAVSILKQRRAS